MGDLANLVIPKSTVVVGEDAEGKEQTVTVRPLDMEGVVLLVQEDRTAFEAIMESDSGLSLNQLLKMAPTFCAKCVAHAAGEPNEWKKVADLGMGAQLKLLEAVWVLTNIDMNDVGKLAGYLASILSLARQTVRLVNAAEASPAEADNGSGDQGNSQTSS